MPEPCTNLEREVQQYEGTISKNQTARTCATRRPTTLRLPAAAMRIEALFCELSHVDILNSRIEEVQSAKVASPRHVDGYNAAWVSMQLEIHLYDANLDGVGQHHRAFPAASE